MASEVSTAGAQQELRRRLAERERELREAHQREAATAELLQVINRPQLALQSVFDAIAQSAGRLCEAEFASVFRFDGEFIGAAASYGVNSEGLAAQQKEFPRPAGEDTSIGWAILRRAVVQIPDVQADPTYGLPALAQIVTYRSVMAVPFLCDGHPIGGIAVGRAQAGPFPEGQIRSCGASQTKPSSPSRTRGCSRQSRQASWNSRRLSTIRPRQAKCSTLLAAPSLIFSPCLTALHKRQAGCVSWPIRRSCCGRATSFALRPTTVRYRPADHGGAPRFGQSEWGSFPKIPSSHAPIGGWGRPRSEMP